MNLEEFKAKCMETAIKRDNCYNLLYASNALNGEAGELANYVKKLYRDEAVNMREPILKEIFDVMWYCAYILDIMGEDFKTVTKLGFDKLAARGKDNCG